MNDNFIFEIRYLIMTEIFTFIYKESRLNLNKTYIQINDCSKKTYVISQYGTFENNTILYIKDLLDKSNEYYYQNISLYKSIDILFYINYNYLYEYPFEIHSLFDFIQFKCNEPSEFEINYIKIKKMVKLH